MSGQSLGPRGSEPVHARYTDDVRQAPVVPHAAGALVWGVVTQVRYPTVLGLFLAGGLATVATVVGLAGAGGPTFATPVAVPLAILALVTWAVAYRYVHAVVRDEREFRPSHVRTGLVKIPDLVLVYGTILGLVYVSWRAAFWALSGHYKPRFAFFLAVLAIVVHTLLATPALLIGDAPSLGSLYDAWRLSSGIRVTLLGLWAIGTVLVIGLWGTLWTLLGAYQPVQALLVVGAATGVVLGGIHLALVRLYERALASRER